MYEEKIRAKLQELNQNESIRNGLFASHYFFVEDENKQEILGQIKKTYSVTSSDVQFDKDSDKLYCLGDVVARVLPVRDKENGTTYGFLVCVDPKEFYTPWEKQFDIDIRENLQIGILSYKRQQAIKLHSSKAGMTAIEARNLSHNIGSHVLSRWNTILEDHRKVIDESNEIIKKTTGFKKAISDKLIPKEHWIKTEESIELIKNSKNLFQYLQMRMDFIAEISTSVPSWEMNLDFSEVLGEFEQQSALLKHIASSEGYNEIPIKYQVLEGCKRVSIPNGNIGKHAFYSIVENFIRNAAKHYKKPTLESSSQFEILIQLHQPSDEYIELVIWDTREGSCNWEIYDKLNTFLDLTRDEAKFVNETTGVLLSGGWGMKEILLSANFLRKHPPEKLILGFDKDEPPLVQIICDNAGDKNCCNGNQCQNEFPGRLGMRFFLRKPKDMCFAGTSEMKSLIHKGTFEIDYIDESMVRENLTTDIPHRLLLVSSVEVREKIKKDPMAPMRIRVWDGKKITDETYLDNYEKYIMEELCSEENLPRLCYLDNSQNVGNWINKFDELVKGGELKQYLAPRTPEENGKYVNFLYHPEQESRLQKAQYLINCHDYMQPMSASYGTNTKLNALGNYEPALRRHFILELIEAALTSVVIFDERVSDFAMSEAFSGYQKSEIFRNMGVHVVRIDKKNIVLEDLIAKWNGIKNGMPDHPAFHFLVIHQGILDKIEKEKKGNSQGLMEKLDCRWKIIDSGRGVPRELKEFKDARFIEISGISKMLEQYDKHALVQTLFSIRRPRLNHEH